MNKKIPFIILGGLFFLVLSFVFYQDKTFGAPLTFVSTPATTSPLTNFAFTVGTTTPQSQYGSTTLAVYGSTTIQTWLNTIHALEVFNAASSSIFNVNTVGGLINVSGTGTSTFTNGISLSGGCFRGADGNCAITSGVTGSGSADQVAYFSASSQIAGDADFTRTEIGYLATNGTTTNATSTSLNVSGQVDFDTYTSAILLTGAGGILAEYTGASCTNQFVRSLSA